MMKRFGILLIALAAAGLGLSAMAQEECSLFEDTCRYQFDDECDVDTGFCPTNTDCFDCSPCAQLSFTSCEECTAEPGCLWCGKDPYCSPQAFQFDPSKGIRGFCAVDDFESTCSVTTNPLPDPLYDAQSWVYDLINVVPAWEAGFTGKGIHIRINDDGLDSNHPELSTNFDESLSCQIFLPEEEDDTHGTACASIAGGSSNDLCAAGVAHEATLSGCKILGGSTTTPEGEGGSSDYLSLFVQDTHVSSNSFGRDGCENLNDRESRRLLQECPFDPDILTSPCADDSACSLVDWAAKRLDTPCENEIAEYCEQFFENDVVACTEYFDLYVACQYNTLSASQREALTTGINEGREGKGTIFVFAAGNEYKRGETVNMEGWLNSRWTITVGAVGKLGKHASYSTTGTALFISAPGGDHEFARNHITARAIVAGGGCHDATIGTSFATPVVSGVAALILQANPNLGWRDVQAVIASTAQVVDDEADDTLITNAAGLQHSYKYGFGIIDAGAATMAALTWKNYGPEQEVRVESGPIDLAIPDAPSGPVTSAVSMDAGSEFVAESVVAFLNLTHSTRGHLAVTLTSPSGTESLLHPGKRPERTLVDERWELLTVRAWGEDPNGEWTLSIVDETEGDAVPRCRDEQDWSIPSSTGDPLSCTDLQDEGLCADGGKGPNWTEEMGELFDPDYAGSDGKTPNQACCACGRSVTNGPCQDVSGWVAPADDPRVNCEILQAFAMCLNGGEGPKFDDLTDGAANGVNDPGLAGTGGLTPGQACCECGGGANAEAAPEVLYSWSLVVYGHTTDGSTFPPGPAGPSQPTPEPATSSVTPVSLACFGSVLVGIAFLFIIL